MTLYSNGIRVLNPPSNLKWRMTMDWFYENIYTMDEGFAARFLELVESKGDNWKRYCLGDQIRCMDFLLGGIKDGE